jgi:hypothetical protein
MVAPFDNDLAEETESADSMDFEGGDSGDGFDADADAEADAATDGFTDEQGFEGDAAVDLSADAGDGFAADAGDAALWDAFEEELADGLDAADDDEFLGRLLGGLGRAAGVVGRGMGSAARTAGRVQSAAQGVRRTAGRVGRVAGAVTPTALAMARLARMLGAGGAADVLGQVGNAAGGVGRVAQRVGGLAGATAQTAGGAQNLFGQLSQLLGQGFDDLDAFDAAADLYVEDGIDEALPAVVGLAARAAARGLGFRNVAQLSLTARRALIRGIAAAARELVRRRGPRAVRALPALARAATRVAQRRGATPQQATQALRRGLPRAAQRVAQTPPVLNRLARPQARGAGAAARRSPAPIARPAGIGRGTPTLRGARRTFRFTGPVTLTVTATR